MTGTYVGGCPEDIELRPSAAKLLESMRDIGYSFETALADIIDNSVSAEAKTICIYNDVDARDEPFVAVVDDARGMSSEMLTAAMRHGSRSPRETRTPGDLGRFGLGLKTASFSQCRILTVVSRVDGIAAARCWDLDHVVARDDWYLKVLSDEAIADLPGIDLLAAGSWSRRTPLLRASEHVLNSQVRNISSRHIAPAGQTPSNAEYFRRTGRLNIHPAFKRMGFSKGVDANGHQSAPIHDAVRTRDGRVWNQLRRFNTAHHTASP